MRKTFLGLMAVAAAFIAVGCGGQAANSTANKPTNAGNGSTAPAADKAAVEAEVRKAIDGLADALNKGDIDALDKIFSDDYTLVDANGVVHDKAARMELARSGKMKFEGLKFSDLKIKTHPAGDGAVVVAHAKGKSMADGKGTDLNSTVTWVIGKSKDKGWQFMNAQITDIKAGAAKPDDKKLDDKPADANAAPAKTEPERK